MRKRWCDKSTHSSTHRDKIDTTASHQHNFTAHTTNPMLTSVNNATTFNCKHFFRFHFCFRLQLQATVRRPITLCLDRYSSRHTSPSLIYNSDCEYSTCSGCHSQSCWWTLVDSSLLGMKLIEKKRDTDRSVHIRTQYVWSLHCQRPSPTRN
jgi:hypothetical protein